MSVNFPKKPNQDRGVLGNQAHTPHNPYAAPTADLDDYYEGDYHTEPFYSRHGRIGRLRYLAYSLMLTVVVWGGAALFAMLLVGLFGSDNVFAISVMAIVALPALIYVAFVPIIRRLNDLNRSGWLSLIALIPYINIIFYLYLIFAPGDVGYNDYGAPAEPPTIGIKILAFFPVVIAIVGIIAAIALPSYMNYVTQPGLQ